MTMPMVTHMNHATNNGIGDWSTTGFILSLFVTAAIAVAGFNAISMQSGFDREEQTAPVLFNDPKANKVDATELVAAQKRELVARPLSQDALNRLLVAARLDRKPTLEEEVADVMGNFAWRTAPGQMNLITIALEQRKFGDVFRHADALSRREKAKDEILALFSLYEQMPQQRKYLVEALKKSPPWRQAFLASAERLNGPRQVEARYQTIVALLKSDVVRRDELSSLIGRLVATGSPEKAYDLWVRTQRPKLEAGNLFDGSFQQAMELQKAGVSNRFPFEWQLETGYSAGAQLVERGSANELQLYWNGQGVPTFAKQTISARPAVYRVTLHGVEASKAARKILAVELLCPGQSAIRLHAANIAGDNVLAYSADQATRCGYPEIRLVGRPDANGANFEMSFTGINLALAS